MKNRLIFLSVVLSFFSLNVAAQITAPKEVPVLKDATIGDSEQNFTVGDVKGTINNKAITLAKPFYPPEAKQAGAEGTVRVRITIGDEGTVLTANMISGNPLLKAATEDAAMRSKFRIARDADGNPIKTEGVLVYNFAFQKANWTEIAHSLSELDRLPVQTLQIPSIKKAFAPEWTSELAMLEKLEEISKTELPMPNSPFADAPKPVLLNNSGSRVVASSTVVRRLNIPAPPSVEQISLVQNLILALQNRLRNDELSLWQFNLGLDLRRAMEILRNPDNHGESSQIIRQNIEKAPVGVSKEVLGALETLAQFFDRPEKRPDSRNEIGKTLTIILNGK
jgi:TonB family protein